jgi:hypothetical protein
MLHLEHLERYIEILVSPLRLVGIRYSLTRENCVIFFVHFIRCLNMNFGHFFLDSLAAWTIFLNNFLE